MKRKKKVKRIVLGTGYPWYSGNAEDGGFSHVCLTKDQLNQSILLRNGKHVSLNYRDTGNWNKVRLVLEVLK